MGSLKIMLAPSNEYNNAKSTISDLNEFVSETFRLCQKWDNFTKAHISIRPSFNDDPAPQQVFLGRTLQPTVP
jgi:hypothetical protein